MITYSAWFWHKHLKKWNIFSDSHCNILINMLDATSTRSESSVQSTAEPTTTTAPTTPTGKLWPFLNNFGVLLPDLSSSCSHASGLHCIKLTINSKHHGNIAQHAASQIQGFMEVATDGKLIINAKFYATVRWLSLIFCQDCFGSFCMIFRPVAIDGSKWWTSHIGKATAKLSHIHNHTCHKVGDQSWTDQIEQTPFFSPYSKAW